MHHRLAAPPLAALATVAGIAVIAAPAAVRAQDAETLAHQRFLRGVEHFDAHRYADALAEFRASYGLFASPNSRLYIARSLFELGRYADAVTEFETTVAESAERARSDRRYEDTRRAAADELRMAESRVGRLRLRVPDAPRWIRVRVRGQVLPRAALGLAVPVTPGRAEVDVDADGYAPEHREVEIVAGRATDLDVTLRATGDGSGAGGGGGGGGGAGRDGGGGQPVIDFGWLARSRSPLRALSIAGFVVGGVGFVAFGGLAIGTNALFSDLRARCGGPCPASEQGAVDSGRGLQVATNVAWVTGTVGLVAGAVLLLVGPRVEPRAQSVSVAFGPEGAAVGGVF